jgi:hypothetical protein
MGTDVLEEPAPSILRPKKCTKELLLPDGAFLPDYTAVNFDLLFKSSLSCFSKILQIE